MNRTTLKTIACLSMLCDHIGFLLFPQVQWLRYIGRLAMPIFAFFIAEGCRYTSNKLRYFLRVFVLGLLCQAVYLAEQVLAGGIYSMYLNILLTFSFSLIICFAYLYWEKALDGENVVKKHLSALLFLGTVLFAAGFCALCHYVESETYFELAIDYGLRGILLPLAALIAKDKNQKLVYFSFATFLFCIVSYEALSYVWFSLLSLPLLACYNGKGGNKILNYACYIFYPAHLAILYLIQLFF